MTKNILLLETDLFRSVGGGQTSYRKLITLNPQNTYYYFIERESITAIRPGNTRAIPLLREELADWSFLHDHQGHFYNVFLECHWLASSVKRSLGRFDFDVVDTPDYKSLGLFIKQVLVQYGCRVGVLALALHGGISIAIRDEWPRNSASPHVLAQTRLRERLQYRAADVRYAISAAYAGELESATGRSARLINPLHITGPIEAQPAVGAGTKPDLVFVGRRQRCKGPDIAVDIAWAAGADAFGALQIVGGDSVGGTGVGSTDLLRNMATRRRVPCDIVTDRTPAQVQALYLGDNVILLPSRYDTFNLAALEALRVGCPVFFSPFCGIAQWLRENAPSLSRFVIDIDCARTAGKVVRETLLNYRSVRDEVATAVANIEPADPLELGTMYAPDDGADEQAVSDVRDLAQRFDSFNRPLPASSAMGPSGLVRSIKTAVPVSIKAAIKSAVRAMRPQQLKLALKQAALDRSVRSDFLGRVALAQARRAGELPHVRSDILTRDERSDAEIGDKLAALSIQVGQTKWARVQIFREMARLERKRGADLVAATYCLRVMRWIGTDEFGDLPFVASTLSAAGLEREASVARAMFEDPELSFDRCRDLLRTQATQHTDPRPVPFAQFDDRRGDVDPKVSVIVSMYDTGNKLVTLLRNIETQTLSARGRVEVVLIDSASPGDERATFERFAAKSQLPIAYARTHDRETIQQAWNRGLGIARAPYITCLGVDEGVHPEALEVLADSLDRTPDVDWVMSDAVVTNVDKAGVYADDVMWYRRGDTPWSHVLLDTTYLGWVGGLYRRSIHDRFGFYDTRFRGAGDTEFKNRIISRIRTLHIPRTLGVFNDYPEERVTQSPRAELEDLRAWYLHRTPAGIAEAFDHRPAADAIELFASTLRYRKAFGLHESTDFDMAYSLGAYLAERKDVKNGQRYRQASEALREYAVRSDRLELRGERRRKQIDAVRHLRSLRSLEKLHRAQFDLSESPAYELFNDNRYEQHWWSWSR